MPNPLAEAFALAAKVRPGIAECLRMTEHRGWIAWSKTELDWQDVGDDIADSLILAACVRELLSVSFGGVEIKCGSGPNSIDIYTVYTSHGWDPHEHRSDSLTLALLAAVAGSGEE